jgi:hypothetical protein
MKKSIAVLKGYFKTGDKPTQQQFYDFLESYLHLDSYILASQVTGLETALETLNTLGINDVEGLQTALSDLNTAITTLEVADVSGLQGILDALAVVSIGDVTGLQAVLDDLATRGIADITGLSDALNGKVDKVAGYGLSQNDFSNYYTGLITTIQNAVTALTYEGVVVEATIIKTLALTDVNKRIKFTNANPIALTVPLDASVAWYTGTKIKGTVQGNGAVTISGAGITFIGNTLTFPKGESFVLVNTALNEWTVEGNAPVAGALVYKTWFVNTSTGNNTTGLYQDSSKPFATIDGIIALGTLNEDDVIWLQNENGTFPLNGVLPAKRLSIVSDVLVTLDLSANANTNFYYCEKKLTINLPKGIIYNNRSGGTGAKMATPNSELYLYLKVDQIYWNVSNVFFDGTAMELYVNKISLKSSFAIAYNGMLKQSSFDLIEVVCLGTNVTLLAMSYNKIKKIRIDLISGTGNFRTTGFDHEIGNITTTASLSIFSNVKFINSTITTSTGIDLFAKYVVISGSIASCPLIKAEASDQGGAYTVFKDFTASLGTGQLKTQWSDFYFENCFIRSTNAPIVILNNSGTYGWANIIAKKSVFEVVNAVPLVTGGAGQTVTMKVMGITTNATALSDQAGTGVTVTQMTNY